MKSKESDTCVDDLIREVLNSTASYIPPVKYVSRPCILCGKTIQAPDYGDCICITICKECNGETDGGVKE